LNIQIMNFLSHNSKMHDKELHNKEFLVRHYNLNYMLFLMFGIIVWNQESD
jgi:hypothetical protein